MQGAQGLVVEEAQVAVGAPSRGPIPPEGLGKLPACDLRASLEGYRVDRGKIGQKVSVEGQPEGCQTLGGPLKSRLCLQLVSLGLCIFFTSLHFFFFYCGRK